MKLSNKLLIVAVVFIMAAVLPVEVFERFQLGIMERNIDKFSSGRINNIWLPLIPDVIDHLLLGQGHYSIYWTSAQQFGNMYPVTHSHNAFLDLLLDYGVLGTIAVLGFFVYVWYEFLKLSRTDDSAMLRGLFYGGHLAMVVFLLSGLNGRFTPEVAHFPLWVAIGIMFGRVGSPISGRVTRDSYISPVSQQRDMA